jgi:6-phosphogluconolactonase
VPLARRRPTRAPIGASILLAAVACAGAGPKGDAASQSAARVPFVYVSGYRPEITIHRLDVDGATMIPAGSAPAGTDPSFLTWDPQARFLFAGNETTPGRVRSFAIDQGTGALRPLNDVPAGGSITAHLSVDRSGRWLLVANYGAAARGTVSVFPIEIDGRLAPAVEMRDFGPASMPHLVTTDPGNRFVFVPCKGGPHVAQLALDVATGRLTPNDPDRARSAPGSGPRHMDFHPNGRFAYVINESALTMTAYRFDATSGRLTEIESVPTLPASATMQGASTADVHVHPSGRLLYGSNRGHDSIVIYRLDPETGRMTLVGHERRTIRRPRNFHIDPSGRLLLVANQDGASVTIFRIDATTGLLAQAGDPVPVGPNPSFVGVLLLPGGSDAQGR